MGGSKVTPESKPRGHQKGQCKETGGVSICAMPVMTAITVQKSTMFSA